MKDKIRHKMTKVRMRKRIKENRRIEKRKKRKISIEVSKEKDKLERKWTD